MKNFIEQQLAATFQQLGDLICDATYKHCTGSEYEGGQQVYTYDEYSVKIAKLDYTLQELNASGGSITTDNKKVLLPTSYLAIEPTTGQDKLVIDDTEYDVLGVKDKFNVLWIIRI